MKRSNLKKSITAVILAVLIIPVSSFGFGSWSQETTARKLCFLYSLSKDWQQTIDLADRPIIYREQKTLISYILPVEFSELWQGRNIEPRPVLTPENSNKITHETIVKDYVVKSSVEF